MHKIIVEGPGMWVYDFVLKDGRTHIGRAQENQIVLSDSRVSSKHAVIIKDGDHVVIEDLGSSNGTIVNGVNVTRHALSRDDKIVLGDKRIQYYCRVSETTRVAENYFFAGSAAPLDKHNTTQDEVKKRLATLPDPSENLHAVLELLVRTVAADNGYIMLLEPSGSSYVVKAFQGINPAAEDGTDHTFSHTVAQSAVESGNFIRTSDASLDERFACAQSIIDLGIKSAICMPLKYEDKVIGLTYLDKRSKEAPFDQVDEFLVQVIADGAAGLLHELDVVPEQVASGPVPTPSQPVECKEKVPEWIQQARASFEAGKRDKAVTLALEQVAERTAVETVTAIFLQEEGAIAYIFSPWAEQESFRDQVLRTVSLDLQNRLNITVPPKGITVVPLKNQRESFLSPPRMRVAEAMPVLRQSLEVGALCLLAPLNTTYLSFAYSGSLRSILDFLSEIA